MEYNDSNYSIGILSVYTDSKDVGIQLKVDLNYRRKNVATILYESFLKETKEYRFNIVFFVNKTIFSDNKSNLIKTLICKM